MRSATDERQGRRLRFAPTIGFVLLAFIVGATLVAQLSGPLDVATLFRSGDTNGVTLGADVAADCLRDAVFTSCGQPSPPLEVGPFDVPTSGAYWFALLLYVPAVGANLLGFSRVSSLVLIGVLNGVAFVMLAALPWLLGRRLPGLHRLRRAWALVILCGLLLPYGVSTWSECLAAALVAGTVAGVAARSPRWAVALVAFGAGISKDPMSVFVILLAFSVAGVGASTPVGWRERVRIIGPVLAGSAAAVAANVAFNMLRFGSVRNVTLLSPVFRVTRVSHVAEQLAALVLSPNGGLAVFWPTLLVPLAVAALAVRRVDRDTRARLGLVAFATGGFLLGLAAWYQPFGWHAWGPRLTIPVIPAAVLAVFVLVGDRVVVPPIVWAVAAAAAIFSVANVAALGAQDTVSTFMNAPSPCREGTALPDPFVRCLMRKAWGRPWLVPDVVRDGLRSPLVAALAGFDVAAGLALCGLSVRISGEGRVRSRPHR